MPGSSPIGPYIATEIDPSELRVLGILDGKVKQDYPVADMIFSPAEIIWHINRKIPLYPGDVIACGTSSGATDMADRQTIVVEIPGIGALNNQLVLARRGTRHRIIMPLSSAGPCQPSA